MIAAHDPRASRARGLAQRALHSLGRGLGEHGWSGQLLFHRVVVLPDFLQALLICSEIRQRRSGGFLKPC